MGHIRIALWVSGSSGSTGVTHFQPWFKPLRISISFVNLDLGIETCYYNGMDSYFKTWSQLFFPFCLIILAVSIIIASRYSSRILRLTYTRSLPVLATLFLLSYTGILRAVSMVLFSYFTITHLPSGNQQIVWSIDASVPIVWVKVYHTIYHVSYVIPNINSLQHHFVYKILITIQDYKSL